MSDRIRATYLIETAEPLQEAAATMAGEQSSGTFTDVPGETDELRTRHGAQVESVVELDAESDPTLPGAAPPSGGRPRPGYTQAEVTLSFPMANVGPSLPNLRATVAGNLFELHSFSGLRLLDLELPDSFARENPGPQFGIDGTRELLDVHDRPIIGTIIKPNVGLTPAETVADVVDAGVDFVKDDERIADPAYSPVEERVEAVMDVAREHEQETGETVMYACNVTGGVSEMLERHDAVKEVGWNCVVVSINSVGISGLLELRRHADLPIHAHRNGWGALSRHPLLGFDYSAFHQFFRLAGADHMHVNGLRNRFTESDSSVVQSARACQDLADESDRVVPVFSSGQWAGQAPDTYRALGNSDLMYLAGGGILGHPDGAAAGVEHLKQGWEAAMQGTPLEEYAEEHEELRTAIDYYGPVGSGR